MTLLSVTLERRLLRNKLSLLLSLSLQNVHQHGDCYWLCMSFIIISIIIIITLRRSKWTDLIRRYFGGWSSRKDWQLIPTAAYNRLKTMGLIWVCNVAPDGLLLASDLHLMKALIQSTPSQRSRLKPLKTDWYSVIFTDRPTSTRITIGRNVHDF